MGEAAPAICASLRCLFRRRRRQHQQSAPLYAASFGGAGGSTSHLRLFTLPLSAAQEAAPAICAYLRCLFRRRRRQHKPSAPLNAASFGAERGGEEAAPTGRSLLSYMRYVRIKILLQKC